MIHIVTKTSTELGPQLRMDCPSCGACNVVAQAADITSREYIYGLIPVSTNKWVTVTCAACSREFRSPKSCDELVSMSPQQVSEVVATYGMSYVSGITKFCIVVSVILGIAPVVGLGCAIAGIIGTRNCRTRWRTAAFVGLVISSLSTGGMILMMVLEKKP